MRFEEVHPTETTVLALLKDLGDRTVTFLENSHTSIAEADTQTPTLALLFVTILLAMGERFMRRRCVKNLLREQRL